jgi:hypothetical protein
VKAVRGTLIAAGALLMGYAVSGALGDTDVTVGALVFLVAVLVLHDGLFLPLAMGAGLLIDRIPTVLRTPVRAAAVVSLAVTVVALPLVLGVGRVPDNPSVLPLPYGRGLLVIYAVVWSAAAVAAMAGRRRARRHRPGRS